MFTMSRASDERGKERVEGQKGKIMWYTYILRCKDNSLYTGITTDIIRRVSEHNAGNGGACTRARLPVELAYKETCKNRSDALKREAQIKRLSRQKKLTLIQHSISSK